MRFPQLKIGQRFDYQGKTYTKTGPLTASEEGTGVGSMIRRSAKVTPLDGPAAPAGQVKQRYSREEAAALCRDYKSRLAKALKQAADADGGLQIEQVLSAIEALDMFGVESDG
ncbi:MAG: polysulfide reductase chain A [Candidatus Thiodiazotropha sp. (ex Dulcina madagascariensis)]|nr:polysulfide reductase chain A [Candidatus Thiodiazotropha sp. (ex Dulcina madagascariensis)]MCU7926042.1 polysulfide reductase chain A [Candidatus Thiodiazotropha sp. (ex Dulcina madagascariensis)]